MLAWLGGEHMIPAVLFSDCSIKPWTCCLCVLCLHSAMLVKRLFLLVLTEMFHFSFDLRASLFAFIYTSSSIFFSLIFLFFFLKLLGVDGLDLCCIASGIRSQPALCVCARFPIICMGFISSASTGFRSRCEVDCL